MLRINQLNKSFGRRRQVVVEGFDLDMEHGEFVTLIGPSGCGKTTVLRIAAGLLPPSSGEVFVDEQPSLGPSRDKAIVFQHFNLFPWRNALDNVAYGLEIQGINRTKRHEIANEYLRLVGLQSHASHYPWQMSGGQQQRIGIARALAINPKLILMDEPFGALDALTRERLQGQLQKIVLEKGLSVLFVTHSIDEALYLSDRIVVMSTHPGRIIAEFKVDLPKPRADYNFRALPEYGRIRGEVWALLEEQLLRAEAVAS